MVYFWLLIINSIGFLFFVVGKNEGARVAEGWRGGKKRLPFKQTMFASFRNEKSEQRLSMLFMLFAFLFFKGEINHLIALEFMVFFLFRIFRGKKIVYGTDHLENLIRFCSCIL